MFSMVSSELLQRSINWFIVSKQFKLFAFFSLIYLASMLELGSTLKSFDTYYFLSFEKTLLLLKVKMLLDPTVNMLSIFFSSRSSSVCLVICSSCRQLNLLFNFSSLVTASFKLLFLSTLAILFFSKDWLQ